MTNYTVLRVQKLKTYANISAAVNHNTRKNDTPNADPNVGNIKSGKGRANPVEYIKNRLEELGITPRKNAVLANEYVLSASPEFFKGKSREEIKEWYKDNRKFLMDKHGAANVVATYLHLDEQTPHIHAIILPLYDANNPTGNKKKAKSKKHKPKWKLSAKHFFDRFKLRNLQTAYAKAMEPYGLTRGVEGSKAKHEKVTRFYGKLDVTIEHIGSETQRLLDKTEQLKGQAPSLLNIYSIWKKQEEQGEAINRLAEQVNEGQKANSALSLEYRTKVQTLKGQNEALQKQLSDKFGFTEEYVKDLENTNQLLKAQTARLSNDIKTDNERIEELEKKLRSEQEKVQAYAMKHKQALDKINQLDPSISPT